jgi:hypothetical protein
MLATICIRLGTSTDKINDRLSVLYVPSPLSHIHTSHPIHLQLLLCCVSRVHERSRHPRFPRGTTKIPNPLTPKPQANHSIPGTRRFRPRTRQRLIRPRRVSTTFLFLCTLLFAVISYVSPFPPQLTLTPISFPVIVAPGMLFMPQARLICNMLVAKLRDTSILSPEELAQVDQVIRAAIGVYTDVFRGPDNAIAVPKNQYDVRRHPSSPSEYIC